MDTSELQKIKQRYNIVGNSDGLNHALDVALQVAPTDLSVLIIGESGVGKEIIPRVIHDNSPRRREKYFAINCGSIPEGTIDSELFGHEKGSFTGAIGESEGYFGIANKGTIFLDEVGELPIQTQARLLRVLETGEYIRVGGTEIRKTDVRIVAATNVNMRKAVSEGRFREVIEKIGEQIGVVERQSALYETKPWGYSSPNDYINACVLVLTTMAPRQVLEATQRIEREMGRTMKSVDSEYHDRIIDIDILMIDDLVIDEPDFKVPHPLMEEREFVMKPLKEILR